MPKPVSEIPKTEVSPDPALERRTRRALSADYKLRILQEAQACPRVAPRALRSWTARCQNAAQCSLHQPAPDGGRGSGSTRSGELSNPRSMPIYINLIVGCAKQVDTFRDTFVCGACGTQDWVSI